MRNKYGAVRTQASCGTWCASRKEANYLSQIRILERAGKVVDVEPHPVFELCINDKKVMKFTADVAYTEDGKRVVVDVKGGNATKTEAYRLRKRIIEAAFEIEITEV